MCPITLELMKVPVIAEDGHTYERSAIEDWFKRGNRNSPKTQARIGQRLMLNHSMKALIESIVERQQESRRRGEGGGTSSTSNASSTITTTTATTTSLSPLPSTQSVEQWLASIRPAFANYAPALKRCGYEDLSFLRDVDETDFKEALVEVGMAKQAHRAVVLRRFRELV
jgi:hypothetical protein